MTTTNYLTPTQFRNAKTRLTKAVRCAARTGNHQRIIDVVDETFAEWDDGDFAYPDDWHRWERARLDAEMALRWAS